MSLKMWFAERHPRGASEKRVAGLPSYALHLRQPEARHEKLLVSRRKGGLSEIEKKALTEKYGAVERVRTAPGKAS